MSEESSHRPSGLQGHLVEIALDPMFVLDGQGHLVEANPAACQFFNRSEQELLGQPLSEIAQPHSNPSSWPQADEMESAIVQGELILLLWNGEQRRVTYRARCQGQPRCQLWILRDITAQSHDAQGKKRQPPPKAQVAQLSPVEHERALNEDRLQALFNQAAIGINQADPDGRFLQVNPTYCRMLGYSEAELLTMRYQDVASPLDTAATENALQRLYAGEASAVTLEKRYIRKDGTVLWTHTVLSILRDEEGQPISDIAIVEDITDRVTAEQALQAERNLFISGPTVVLKWSPEPGWPVLYVSPNVEAQLGYTPEELMTGKILSSQLLHPDDCDRIAADVAHHTAAGRQHYAQEYRLRHANGEYRWIDDFTHVIYDNQGEVVQFLGYIQDVTDRKQIELALQQSEATKQAMLEAIPDVLLRVNRQGIRHDFIAGGETSVCGAVDNHSIYDLLPKALADQKMSFLTKALDTGKTQQYEHTLTVWGERSYEEIRIMPLDHDEALIVVRDITDRVTAAQALRESQQRFQAIFNQMYQFIGLLTPDGILLEANQTALDFGGLAREDVVGRPFWQVSWWMISPETQVQLQQAIAAAAQGEFIRYEVKVQGKDQRVIIIDFSLRPVFDEHNQVVLLIPEGREITELKQLELELERTKLFLEQTNTMARVGGWEVDFQRQNAVRWTRITREIHEVEADFKPTFENTLHFYPGDNPHQRITAAIKQAHQTGQPWDKKRQIRTAKGNLRWVRVLGQAEFAEGVCTRIYGSFQDIDDQMRAELKLQELTQQLQQANKALNRLAMVDGLTQIANRRQFDHVLPQEWERAKRNHTFLSLILVDIDFFKPYNDNYGHPAGDRCLAQVANILAQVVQRPGDLVARYGGEEFSLVLPQTTIQGAVSVAEHIQAAMSAAQIPHEFSAISDRITLSVGVVCCIPQPQHQPGQLIAWADTALYQAKNSGRNTYRLATLPIEAVRAPELETTVGSSALVVD